MHSLQFLPSYPHVFRLFSLLPLSPPPFSHSSSLLPLHHREVIERRPEDSKIETLKQIRALFPADYHPLHAGFGNKSSVREGEVSCCTICSLRTRPSHAEGSGSETIQFVKFLAVHKYTHAQKVEYNASRKRYNAFAYGGAILSVSHF